MTSSFSLYKLITSNSRSFFSLFAASASFSTCTFSSFSRPTSLANSFFFSFNSFRLVSATPRSSVHFATNASNSFFSSSNASTFVFASLRSLSTRLFSSSNSFFCVSISFKEASSLPVSSAKLARFSSNDETSSLSADAFCVFSSSTLTLFSNSLFFVSSSWISCFIPSITPVKRSFSSFISFASLRDDPISDSLSLYLLTSASNWMIPSSNHKTLRNTLCVGSEKIILLLR